MKLTITGPAIPNIPGQAKPAANPDVIWRYDGNPVVGRRPLPRVTGIYNSAVVPWQGGFIGVFRTEGMDRVSHHVHGALLLRSRGDGELREDAQPVVLFTVGVASAAMIRV